MRTWLVLPAMIFTLFACVQDDADADTDGPDVGAPDGGDAADAKPRGVDSCKERYFSKLAFECATIDCGEALTCVTDWDCLTCADRCEALPCGSDQDCVDGYGHLCDDVEWRCERYITAENLRCSPHDPNESRCGDGECSSDESCESCEQDCGYCPGTAPIMAPCTSDADCESGWCDDWCVGECSSGWDCVGDGNGVLYGDCVPANDGNWYCFPNCTVVGGCAAYPGTSCVTLESIDGWDANVCSA